MDNQTYLIFLQKQGFDAKMAAAFDAIAAMKAHVYGGDPKKPAVEKFLEFRQSEIIDCLTGPDWNDVEIIEGLEAGVTREEFERFHDQDRQRLVDQARWIAMAQEQLSG